MCVAFTVTRGLVCVFTRRRTDGWSAELSVRLHRQTMFFCLLFSFTQELPSLLCMCLRLLAWRACRQSSLHCCCSATWRWFSAEMWRLSGSSVSVHCASSWAIKLAWNVKRSVKWQFTLRSTMLLSLCEALTAQKRAHHHAASVSLLLLIITAELEMNYFINNIGLHQEL